ncbi:hypothetical protein D9X91_12690 [Falsibacillus albus]|uniref:Peptidase M50 domain-containing protein n=1 Tax=Falsibacillus albus TaxID=2478915 RepID=A0A3L7JYR3_9BACI|nr:hypothetical protein D9X91_12690 [Falsibacillus albus]
MVHIIFLMFFFLLKCSVTVIVASLLIFLHELGHGLTAKAVGWELKEIQIGSGKTKTFIDTGDFQLNIGIWFFVSGWCIWEEPIGDEHAIKRILVLLGGPIVTILLTLGLMIGVAKITILDDWPWLITIGILSVQCFFSLIPMKYPGTDLDSDGKQIYQNIIHVFKN